MKYIYTASPTHSVVFYLTGLRFRMTEGELDPQQRTFETIRVG